MQRLVNEFDGQNLFVRQTRALLMFQNFSEDAIKVVILAIDEAYQAGDKYVGTEHILVGLAKSPAEKLQPIFHGQKLSADKIITAIASLKKKEGCERKSANLLLAIETKPLFSPRCTRVFQYCQNLELATETALFLAIFDEADQSDCNGYAYQVLLKLKSNIDEIKSQLNTR